VIITFKVILMIMVIFTMLMLFGFDDDEKDMKGYFAAICITSIIALTVSFVAF